MKKVWCTVALLAGVFDARLARAQEAGSEAGAASVETAETADSPPAPAAAASPEHEIVPPRAHERKTSLEPKVALPAPKGRVTFQSDPIADGCIILVSLGSAGVLELINSTGEIRPQQISPNVNLIGIDRAAVTQKVDDSAGPRSNLGLGAAAAFAILDPVLTGFREKDAQAGLVDAIMYSETAALTLALTNVVKMAVRRPRPLAYTAAEAHKGEEGWSNASTDSSLSFFSGHASMTGAIGATATYLAFARSSGKLRPWLTLGFFSALTTYVSYERVRAGKHFPTDVVAGAFAGAGIGVVVPHLHRTEDVLQRRVWVGFAPAVDRGGSAQGGALTLNGLF